MSATFAVRTAEPSTLTVFGRAAAGEWVRLRTVRTTWWCLLAAAVTILGIGGTMALDADDVLASGALPPATAAGEFGVMLGQFALLVLALLAVTQESATGAIGPSLQWTPRRGVLLAARMAVPVVAATVAGVLLALIADVVAWLIEPGLPLGFAALASSLGGIAGVLLAGGVLAVGIGLLLRSTAGALATVFLVQLVLPFLLPAFGAQWMADLGELLPGTAVVWTLLGEPEEMTAATATALLIAWPAAASAAGGWSLLRRDAG
jgi:ABC-2 type transport system permease protein